MKMYLPIKTFLGVLQSRDKSMQYRVFRKMQTNYFTRFNFKITYMLEDMNYILLLSVFNILKICVDIIRFKLDKVSIYLVYSL